MRSSSCPRCTSLAHPRRRCSIRVVVVVHSHRCWSIRIVVSPFASLSAHLRHHWSICALVGTSASSLVHSQRCRPICVVVSPFASLSVHSHHRPPIRVIVGPFELSSAHSCHCWPIHIVVSPSAPLLALPIHVIVGASNVVVGVHHIGMGLRGYYLGNRKPRPWHLKPRADVRNAQLMFEAPCPRLKTPGGIQSPRSHPTDRHSLVPKPTPWLLNSWANIRAVLNLGWCTSASASARTKTFV